MLHSTPPVFSYLSGFRSALMPTLFLHNTCAGISVSFPNTKKLPHSATFASMALVREEKTGDRRLIARDQHLYLSANGSEVLQRLAVSQRRAFGRSAQIDAGRPAFFINRHGQVAEEPARDSFLGRLF